MHLGNLPMNFVVLLVCLLSILLGWLFNVYWIIYYTTFQQLYSGSWEIKKKTFKKFKFNRDGQQSQWLK
jgi:hypothetical protein